jgi:AmmeMemoRadiSam system protein B/AmmeMemoRadiSam system protein A
MEKIRFFLVFTLLFAICSQINANAQAIKEPNVSGQFYPADKTALSQQIGKFLENAAPERMDGDIICLISPHAGYDFSGQTAAFGYKLIRNKPYKTVVIIGPSHYYGFSGISVYASGKFRTPLGELEIDSDFTQKIINSGQNISFIPQAFTKEHSVEVQLPFLQKSLADFKIVPIVSGDCGYQTLKNLSENLIKAIGQRKDVLIVASTDLTHSYDYQETEIIDRINLSYLQKMSADELYFKLKEGAARMCGGYPVVAAMLTAKGLGHTCLKVLSYTNSAQVAGKKTKGLWTVGYVSAVMDAGQPGAKPEPLKSEEVTLLNPTQKKRLLEIARGTIEEYLSNGKRLDFKEEDGRLKEISGAFVTLHKNKELRGCIGNIIGQKPLFETVRDMAIESATGDPRFGPVAKDELKEIEIEISVLSPLKKITRIDEFKLGTHGVLVRRGFAQGVFLPQVAVETGWSKEEFLSYLCEHKAGLSSDAWKDPATEIFIFGAEVFSE